MNDTTTCRHCQGLIAGKASKCQHCKKWIRRDSCQLTAASSQGRR